MYFARLKAASRNLDMINRWQH